jgi:hypothetical protein
MSNSNNYLIVKFRNYSLLIKPDKNKKAGLPGPALLIY